jgi:hypothetical protein
VSPANIICNKCIFSWQAVTKGGKDSERIFQARDAFRRDDQFNFQTDRSGNFAILLLIASSNFRLLNHSKAVGHGSNRRLCTFQ